VPKSFILFFYFLLILTLLSSITIETTFGSTQKPSVPQFTVKLIDRSYDVPATQSIDPYTGENVTIPSHRVENRTITVTIDNQAFASKLLYDIRVRGHFSKAWTEVYQPSDGFPIQSDSEYTVLSFSSTGGDYFYGSQSAMIRAPSGGQVDFQVEAMNGVVSHVVSIPVPDTGWIFTGETSDWSDTQTLTIPASETATTPNTSSSQTTSVTAIPTEPSSPQSSVLFGLGWLGVGVIVLVVVFAILLATTALFWRKRVVK
jgi:hypothetical protein